MMFAEVGAAVLALLILSSVLYFGLASAVQSLKQEDAFVEKQYKAFQASEALLKTRLLAETHHRLDWARLGELCGDWLRTKAVLKLWEYNASLLVDGKRCGDAVENGVGVSRIALCERDDGGEPCVLKLVVA